MNEGRIRTIVLGIFLHEDRLLVFRGDDPARDVVFYRPLGGGVEFGERSTDAFVREMREELGAELTGIRYLGMIENIFTHAGKRGHEYALLYAARFTDPAFYARAGVDRRRQRAADPGAVEAAGRLSERRSAGAQGAAGVSG